MSVDDLLKENPMSEIHITVIRQEGSCEPPSTVAISPGRRAEKHTSPSLIRSIQLLSSWREWKSSSVVGDCQIFVRFAPDQTGSGDTRYMERPVRGPFEALERALAGEPAPAKGSSIAHRGWFTAAPFRA